MDFLVVYALVRITLAPLLVITVIALVCDINFDFAVVAIGVVVVVLSLSLHLSF